MCVCVCVCVCVYMHTCEGLLQPLCTAVEITSSCQTYSRNLFLLSFLSLLSSFLITVLSPSAYPPPPLPLSLCHLLSYFTTHFPLPFLHSLTHACFTIRDVASRLLGAVRANPKSSLTHLDLSYNRLDDQCMESLCQALSHLPHGLTTLELSDCGITLKGEWWVHCAPVALGGRANECSPAPSI